MIRALHLLLPLALLVAGVVGCKDDREAAEQKAAALEEKAQALAAEAEKAAADAKRAAAEAHAQMGEDAPSAPGRQENLQDSLKRFEAAMKGRIEGAGVESVPFRELKALLPESLEGFERVDAGGQTTGAMGLQVSTAHARFEGSDGARLDLKITDVGSMKAFAALAGTGWMGVQIDKEDSDGYEKTLEFEGHPAFETYRRSGERGELKLIVAERFMVEVDGRRAKMDAVREAARAVDLAGLVKMKDVGVKRIDRAE